MALLIYNTLTRQKEEFREISPGRVKMYVCGVTVYDYCHLGHARAYTAFDTVFRYLRYKGYDVTYVRNITDIDDKIIKKASGTNMRGLSPKEKVYAVAERYASEFHKDAESLNLALPAYEPRATEYIPRMIDIIEGLLKNGMAYFSLGDVYFDVSAFKRYGVLSGRDTQDMRAGARVKPEEAKRGPLDFALWKSAKDGEPSWESPWGRGRPGWHIECSAMSLGLLGKEFDIHGGGQDLIFPHHENEIAQSEGYTGRPPVRFWMHNGFVTVKKEKMSKSLGNFFTLRDIFKRYDPNIVRFSLLSQHYRSPIDFSARLLSDAESAFRRIQDCVERAETCIKGRQAPAQKGIPAKIKESFIQAMDDDFNTAKAIAVCFDITRDINSIMSSGGKDIQKICGLLGALKEFLGVLGIRYSPADTIRVSTGDEMPAGDEEIEKFIYGEDRGSIISLIKMRNYFRRVKKWAEADRIRRRLIENGYALRDTASVTECTKKQ